MKRVLFYLLMIIAIAPVCKAQDPEFTQFYAAPLHLNPALAGISYGPRVNLNYRNEWPSLEKGYVTYAASFDMHIDKLSGGIGVLFLGDRVANGLLNTYSISLMYAYQLKLSRKFGIKFGVQGGYTRRTVDWNNLTYSDMIDPIFGFQDAFGNLTPTAEPVPDNTKIGYADFGAGMVAFSPKVYGGISVKHLTRPKESFIGEDTRVPMRIALHAGGDINLSRDPRKNYALSPNVLLAQQSNFTQLNIGTYVFMEKVYAGVWFRHTFSNSDAVIGLLGLRISYIRIAYSYDYTISELQGKSGGAHEVSFTFNLGGEDNSINPKRKQGQLECPSMLNF